MLCDVSAVCNVSVKVTSVRDVSLVSVGVTSVRDVSLVSIGVTSVRDVSLVCNVSVGVVWCVVCVVVCSSRPLLPLP